MRNEILLLLSIPLIYGGVLLFLKLFGSRGLTCFTVLATIAANIEVLILVDAFGLEQTLGNILFASTFFGNGYFKRAVWEKSGYQRSKYWYCFFFGVCRAFTAMVVVSARRQRLGI